MQLSLYKPLQSCKDNPIRCSKTTVFFVSKSNLTQSENWTGNICTGNNCTSNVCTGNYNTFNKRNNKHNQLRLFISHTHSRIFNMIPLYSIHHIINIILIHHIINIWHKFIKLKITLLFQLFIYTSSCVIGACVIGAKSIIGAHFPIPIVPW